MKRNKLRKVKPTEIPIEASGAKGWMTEAGRRLKKCSVFSSTRTSD
ncbi:hypothetical protein [Maribellus sediminis]|nr:hypothetical protein [Maribellus sediminis]